MSILRQPKSAVAESAAAGPSFARPKVLTVDLGPEHVTEIAGAGFNIRSGTFGTPIKVQRSNRFFPIAPNGELPNLAEQEVMIADLASLPASGEIEIAEEPIGEGVWQQAKHGELDPRPRLMRLAREYLDRIYSHGGAFVLFADFRRAPDYIWGEARAIDYGDRLHDDNWCLLSALDAVKVNHDLGNEVNVAHSLSPALDEALVGSTFTCVIEPRSAAAERWVTLATNKFGKPVAGLLLPEEKGQGVVLILPRVDAKGALLRNLLEDLLPRFSPRLFPENERAAWTECAEYALPGVAECRAKIEAVKDAAANEVEALETAIAGHQASHGYLHKLLSATGDELVAAVKQTLESIGFERVVDVDVEEGTKDGRLREDLQIWRDPGPVVLVEVKGINGLPRDEDVFQVLKNVLPRTKEWQRFDIRALALVNHQRALPPLERDGNPFQPAQIENAEGQELGLLSTWDLYRLARGFALYEWLPEDLLGMLSETAGAIDPLPNHYTPIGTITKFYEQAEAITVQLGEGVQLRQGERLGYALPLGFFEEIAASIQSSGEDVELAPPGAEVGVKTKLGKTRARVKTPVYRVSREPGGRTAGSSG